ncbi:large ribosomal subunit protein uL10z-like [Rutidosis leptorrhynchoides]|uniref:large ribosomal subunit protein uL10z-like n=1 Tax=Rutidosis leptorrhynchoides TaxID=125765 RepID=UPI003A9978F5
MASKAVRKVVHHQKLLNHLKNNTHILLITADNLNANQVKAVKEGLHKEASFLMGNNAWLKRSIAIHAPATGNNAFAGLVPYISGKVGLVFTKSDPEQVSEFVSSSIKLRPLLCSSMDIGMGSIWQWLMVTHFDLVDNAIITLLAIVRIQENTSFLSGGKMGGWITGQKRLYLYNDEGKSDLGAPMDE